MNHHVQDSLIASKDELGAMLKNLPEYEGLPAIDNSEDYATAWVPPFHSNNGFCKSEY